MEIGSNSAEEFSTDLLRVYYGRLFPYDSMFNWISYGNDPSSESDFVDRDFFSRREWSFTIEDDIYIRYQSFRDQKEFRDAIEKRQPHKIDIGAVFNAHPKDHNTMKSDALKTVERELVFDIDMTDYDSIRTCCSGANICLRCWPYMTMAVKVVDSTLRNDFGYKNIFWIYSGRRGVHCWVCDPPARSLSNEARSAVVDYMSVELKGKDDGTDQRKRNSPISYPFHPMIRRSYTILEPYFEEYIADGRGQGLLEDPSSYMAILNSIPEEYDSIKTTIDEKWRKAKRSGEEYTGAKRWQDIKAATSLQILSDPANLEGKKRKINYVRLEEWRVELVLYHCYPRLDANVSKMQNHLLKSPFCIHPKTGRVCVPIDPKFADDFNPFTVPTVRSLCAQVPTSPPPPSFSMLCIEHNMYDISNEKI